VARVWRAVALCGAVTLAFGFAVTPAARKKATASTATVKKAAATAAAKKAASSAPAKKAAAPVEPTAPPRMTAAVELGIQNAAAMIPFYEMLYRLEQHHNEGEPVRVLHFGDSHTASDDWAGEMRQRFQQRFGDGGPGFTQAGRPFAGFRRYDSRASMSRGWAAAGALARHTDGLTGLAGFSLETDRPGETITLEAEGRLLEVFYLRQEGGGAFQIEDNGSTLGSVSTDGAAGPAYYRKELPSGSHRLVLRTTGGAPVRVYGWVLEKSGGVTWETLGVNGAQVETLLQQHAGLLRSHIERRNPALIVLAYGTNEARRRDLTEEAYRADLARVVGLVRQSAPAASILIVGAPDQGIRTRRRAVVVTPDGVDRIIVAQREAALAAGCGFWNLRTAMGGAGSMKQWVMAGLAQRDYVHFTTPGYRLLGDSLYELLMGQYGIFQTVRQHVVGSNENGPPKQNH
jgi:lysophospholipase L1-like esterase